MNNSISRSFQRSKPKHLEYHAQEKGLVEIPKSKENLIVKIRGLLKSRCNCGSGFSELHRALRDFDPTKTYEISKEDLLSALDICGILLSLNEVK